MDENCAASLPHLKDTFDLHGNAARQRDHADGAARPFAVDFAKDLDHQVAEAVDHLGLILEVGSSVDHAECLDEPLHLVETAEFRLDNSENVEPNFARSGFALRDIEILSKPPD